MKFELKTENENYSKSFSQFLGIVFIVTFIIFIYVVALRSRIISRNYEIDFYCRLLTVEKSKLHFKKLSKLSNLKSKQQIWEFCREVIK